MMTPTTDEIRRKNFLENKKLCEDNPDIFMICPRCWGTKFMWTGVNTARLTICNYCNNQGVIAWIDKLFNGKNNAFTEEKTMDPCTAAVISKLAEDSDLLGLTNFFCESVDELKRLSELKDEIKDSNIRERIVELLNDINKLKGVIEIAYEKEWGRKLDWGTKKSP